MAYTVKKLSEISGVTVRALHFYEEAGLLKPAYYGSNGYRYYGERELLQLQQILFFKELGLTLKQIRKVLGKSDFDQITALHSHRQALSREGEKIARLLNTIDETIQHLQGIKKMKDEQMFDGFNIALVRASKGQSYSAAEEVAFKSVKNPKADPEHYGEVIKIAHAIFRELAYCIEKGLDPASGEVQKMIKKHHTFMAKNHDATQEVYRAFALLYAEHPAFRKQLEPFHSQLPEFMGAAMQIFADAQSS